MKTVFFNSSHASPTLKSQYTLSLPGGLTLREGDTIALQSLTAPYCVFNISSFYNNNSFSYIFNGTTYTMTVRDGYYTITDLNNLLQATMKANGHYRLDSVGTEVYYLKIYYNPNLYAVQLNCSVISSTLPVGYTNPQNFYTSGADTCMQLVIPATNITQMFGFVPGTYPAAPQSTAYSTVSTKTPNGAQVNSFILTCSLVNNTLNPSRSDAFYSFAPNVSFGQNINVQPNNLIWMPTRAGSYSSITIQFLDQNYGTIQNWQDTNVAVQLLIKSST